jgi:zinc/manganese transport system substrate-binding protein
MASCRAVGAFGIICELEVIAMSLPFSSARRAGLRALGAGVWCGGVSLPAPVRAAAPARLVASFSIVADVCRELLPPDIEVTTLVGANADAHVFEPSAADGRRLAQADVVVINGLGFEGWMTRLIQVSGYKGPLVVAGEEAPTSAAAPAHRHGAHDHRHAGPDPHIWQDLGLMRGAVGRIAAALSARWPAQAGAITQRRDAYLVRLSQLDQRVRAWLAQVPREQRRAITSHDAFGRFGAAYGVEFLAPQGWSTHSEPSAAAVGRLIRQIRQQRIRALFVENISDRRLIQRIAQESGAQVGGTLYSDALSAPGGPADTYLRLFEHNARTIAQALGATVSP